MASIKIENAKIMFRDFAGKVDEYNPTGKRSFCVILDEDMAQQFQDDGFNIKVTKPKNADYFPVKYLKVNVSYKVSAPLVRCYFGNKYRDYSENTLMAIDHMNFENVDLVLSVSRGMYLGKPYTTAYLSEFHGVVKESPYASKYSGYSSMDADDDIITMD